MPLYIKDDATAELAAQLAQKRGVSNQEAVRQAVQAELQRMAAAILLQLPYRIACLRWGGSSPLGKVVPRVFGCLLIGLLLANWLLDTILGIVAQHG